MAAATRPKRGRPAPAWRVHVLSRERNAADFDAVIAKFKAKLPPAEAALLEGAGAGALRNGLPSSTGADPRDAVQPRWPAETRVLFVATPAELPLLAARASSAMALGAAAPALLLVQAARLQVSAQRPVGGVRATAFEQIIITSHVELGTIVTLPEWRRQGAGRALVAALRMSVRAGGILYTDKAPCLVGDALRFWGGVGLELRGGEGHPMPPRGSHGASMPAAADRRTLMAEVVGERWCCEHCAEESPHSAWCCATASCGMRRPGRPEVWHSAPALSAKTTPNTPARPASRDAPTRASSAAPWEAVTPAKQVVRARAVPPSEAAPTPTLAAKRTKPGWCIRSICTRAGCSKSMHGLRDSFVGGFCTVTCRSAHFRAMGLDVPSKGGAGAAAH